MQSGLRQINYASRQASTVGSSDNDFFIGPAAAFSMVTSPATFIKPEGAAHRNVHSFAKDATEFHRTVSAYKIEDWWAEDIDLNCNISSAFNEFSMAMQVVGFNKNPRESDKVRHRFKSMARLFFPERGRGEVLESLSYVVANFAAQADAHSLLLRLRAGNPQHEAAHTPIGFQIGRDSNLRGFYALRGDGPVVANPKDYDIHIFNRLNAIRLDGYTSHQIESRAIIMPPGSLTYWRGMGCEFPAIVAEPRRPTDSFFLSLEMKKTGNETAHYDKPGLLDNLHDKLRSRYLHPAERVLA